ncbi:MAG: dihydroneopterin aldolase [Luteibaculaceae bacterium]
MQIIEVKGIRVYANHGCLPQETTIGQEYQVDVTLFCDFTASAVEDNLEKTIDYVFVNSIVVEECKIANKLIENVGYRILNRLKESFDILEKAQVKVIKFNPPINGDVDFVAITIEG